jgi:hypothetical protein
LDKFFFFLTPTPSFNQMMILPSKIGRFYDKQSYYRDPSSTPMLLQSLCG